MEVELININGEDLEHLPLFFRKIYHNEMVDYNEEKKLMRYSNKLQCGIFRDSFSLREISKTIDHNIFKNKTNE